MCDGVVKGLPRTLPGVGKGLPQTLPGVGKGLPWRLPGFFTSLFLFYFLLLVTTCLMTSTNAT